MQKTFKNMWVIINKSNRICAGTVSYSKKTTIALLVGEIDDGTKWKNRQGFGDRCIKVNVTFDIVKS